MNRRPLKKTSEIEYMVEDGESENESRESSHRRRERIRDRRRNPRGEREQDTTVSKIREKRWKEDVREKTEVRTIGQ